MPASLRVIEATPCIQENTVGAVYHIQAHSCGQYCTNSAWKLQTREPLIFLGDTLLQHVFHWVLIMVIVLVVAKAVF